MTDPAPTAPELVEATTRAEARLAGVQEAIRAVDAKASLAATVQAAGLGVVLTAVQGRPDGVTLLGLGLLLTALGCSAAVVFPRLAARQARQRRDALYFGELRTHRPQELAIQLTRQTADQRLDAVCRQVIVVSKIAWRKHRLLQASLVATTISAILLGVGVLA